MKAGLVAAVKAFTELATGARDFAGEVRGAATLVFGPGDVAHAYAVDERVSLRQAGQVGEVLAAVAAIARIAMKARFLAPISAAMYSGPGRQRLLTVR